MTSKDLIEHLETLGYEPTAYSGRGMNGRYVVSVSVEYRPDAFEVGFQLGRDHAEFPGTPDMDAMGHGVVLYWPNMPWPK